MLRGHLTCPADRSGIPHLPELAAQTLGLHLTLDDIKATRLSCHVLCYSLGCHPVTVRVMVPNPATPEQSVRVTPATMLPSTWTHLQKVIFDWSLWKELSSQGLHRAVQDIAVACKAKGVSEIHLEGCPNLSAEDCSTLLLYLAPIRVHFVQFRPRSLWSSCDAAARTVEGNWIDSDSGPGGFAGVSCLLRDDELDWNAHCTEVLAKLEDLQRLQLFVDLDQHEVAKRMYQDAGTLQNGYLDTFSGLHSLSTLAAVTALTAHTLPRIYPSNALEGLGGPGEEDGKYQCILRGIHPCFFAPHLEQVPSLQSLRSLSMDLLVADNEDERAPGQPLAPTSSSRFLARLPTLQHLTLRMHCQRGLKGVVEVLATMTSLQSLHLILLHHALGEDQVPWQEAPVLPFYEVEELSFLTQLSVLTSTKLNLEQRCLWSRARFPDKELSEYKASTFQMIPTVDTTGEERVLCLPCFPVWSAMWCANVCSLSVHDANYYSNDIMELAKLSTLQRLTLTGVYVTGEKPAALSYLSALRKLTYMHVALVDDFFQMNCDDAQECATLSFSNCIAMGFARSLAQLQNLELNLVDTNCLTSRGMLAFMRACTQLTRLVINEFDHSHLARRCSTIKPPMTEAKFCTLLEGLVAPQVLAKVRMLKQIYDADGQPQQYTMTLGHLISHKEVQQELVGLQTAEAMRMLLNTAAQGDMLGGDRFYRRILMLL